MGAVLSTQLRLPPGTSWSEICLASLAGIVILWLGQAIYNLYWHPLAHVPGPFWNRVSSIPSWIATISGQRHVWLWQQFEMYGSPIRPEPNTALFRDPEAYSTIYAMKANVRRSRFYEAFQLKADETNTITTIDVAEHGKRRKFLNICFSEKMVREACNFVVRHVDRWHEIMAQPLSPGEWSDVVEMSHNIDCLVFDIMGDLNFGQSFEIKEPGKQPFEHVPHLITEVMQFYYPMCRSPFLKTLLWLKPRGLDALLDIVSPRPIKEYFEFLDTSVKRRIALAMEQEHKPESDQRKDIFHFLYHAKDPQTGARAYDDKELKGEASMLVVGGSDTSAVSLSGTFFHLTGDLRRLRKAEKEVLETFGSVDEIVHGPKLAGCTYLKACLDEGMRLTPAGPAELPREVLPGGIVIKDKYYPAGTIVGGSAYCDFRNTQVFGDPDLFRPERWIVDDEHGVSQEDVQRAKSAFIPFGTGPGHCVGKVFAVSEMMIVLARTLYRFEIRRAPGSTFGAEHAGLGWGARNPTKMHLRDAYIALREGPEVQLRLRTTQ